MHVIETRVNCKCVQCLEHSVVVELAYRFNYEVNDLCHRGVGAKSQLLLDKAAEVSHKVVVFGDGLQLATVITVGRVVGLLIHTVLETPLIVKNNG